MTFLHTGLQGSISAGSYTGPGAPLAAGTSAQASASGPRTIGQQAFGVVAGDMDGSNAPAYAILGGGALALGLLVFIWWSLPR